MNIRNRDIREKPTRSRFNIVSTVSTNTTTHFSLPPILSCSSVRAVKKSKILGKFEKKLLSSCSKLEKQKNEYTEKIKETKERLKKVKEIKEKYQISGPIRVKLTNDNLQRLEDRAKKIFRMKKETAAVKVLENWWKRRMIMVNLAMSKVLYDQSALIIQRFWKKIICNKKKIAEEAVKFTKVKRIQKVVRDFLMRKRLKLQENILEMQKTFEYFAQEREKLLKTSATLIQKYFRAYLIRKPSKVPKPLKIQISTPEELSPAKTIFTTESLKNLIITRNKEMKFKLLAVPETNLMPTGRLRSNTESSTRLGTIQEIKGKKT